MAAQSSIPPLRRTLPTLPELSSEPDHRELAMAYANHLLWLRQQWPAVVDAIEANAADRLLVHQKLDRLLKSDPAKAMVAVRIMAIVTAIAIVACIACLVAVHAGA
jgi:hypothetical protein